MTFGVLASSFAANMAVKLNEVELENEYPQAAKAIIESFYVDDGLVGAEQSKKLESSRANCKNCSTREDLYCGTGKLVMTAS